MLFNVIIAIIAITLFILVTSDLFMPQDYSNTLTIDNDKLVRMVWYGTFILAIGATVIRLYHKRKLQALKHATMWFGIAAAILVFYTFRYDLQMIAGQTLATLLPGTPYTQFTKQGKTVVTLRAEDSEHFYANAEINGTRVNMLVDTGATSVIIAHADAKKIGVNTDTLQYDIPLYTANGVGRVARTKLNSVTIGGITINNISALIGQENAMNTSLLGMDWLSRLTKFEFQNDKLILTQ